MLFRSSLVLLAALPALAETGGLTALPWAPHTETLRSEQIVANGNFNGGTSSWTTSGAWTYDAAVTRTADGSGSLSISNQSAEVSTDQLILAATVDQFRLYRPEIWLRASTTGSAGTFRWYVFVQGLAGSCGTNINVSSLDTTWKSYTLLANDCAYMFNGPPNVGQNITIRLLAAGIPSGTTLWVDDVTLRPIEPYLALFPLYPNYRGMLWPDQGTTIKWNTMAWPPEGYVYTGLKSSVQVVRASDSNVMATVENALSAPVTDTENKWYGFSITQQTYDASGLADGVYYLRASLRETDGTHIYTYPDYKIVKEAPSVQRNGWYAWVDKYNRFVLNGKPVFLWGGYAGFSGSYNTFPPGASALSTSADAYRNLALSCSAAPTACSATNHTPTVHWTNKFGLADNGATFWRQYAELGFNAVNVAQSFGAYNIGHTTPVTPSTGAVITGTASSSGTTVTGSGTDFGGQVKGPSTAGLDFGDVLRRNEVATTGTITNSSLNVTGTGTLFLTELRPGDRICAGGSCRFVRRIDSNTALVIHAVTGSGPPTWTDTAFTVDQYRKVTAVASATSLTIDAPFVPDAPSSSSLSYEQCATDGAGLRWTSGNDFISPFITAAQDYGIWFWHITNNHGHVDAGLWHGAQWAHRCNLTSAQDYARWMRRFKPLNQPGYLGLYISDEPTVFDSYEGRRMGVVYAFNSSKGDRDSNMGGINLGIEASPAFGTWQWPQFYDAFGTDPYPMNGSGAGNTNDAVWGTTRWHKMGRVWRWPRSAQAGYFDSRGAVHAYQLFAWSSDVASYPDIPSNKTQVVSTIAAGATGMMAWAMSWSGGLTLDREAARWRAFRPVALYIKQFLPILNQPIEDLSSRYDGEAEYGRIIASISNANIKCSTRRFSDTLLLACANISFDPQTATITTVEDIPGKVHNPWWGEDITPATSTTFSYTFDGLNGGDGTAGAGTITSSGTTVTCSGCDFTSLFGPVGVLEPYYKPLILANTSTATRQVEEVLSTTQVRINLAATWSSQSWSYVMPAGRLRAAEIFLIRPTAGSRIRAGE